jgi:hypothetical protein
MNSDRLGAVHRRWRGLDTDWQSVVIGAVVVSAVAAGVWIPW